MTGIFALDYAVGREIELWLLYVVPVGLASLVIGPRHGYIVAGTATGLLHLSGYLRGNPYTTIAAFVLDRTSEGVAFFLMAYLIGLARIGVARSDSASTNTQSWHT